jgi:hypothetical protein
MLLINSIRPEPFDSPFGLSLAKTERLDQDRLVEGQTAQDIDSSGPPFMVRQAHHERRELIRVSLILF